MNKFMSQCIFYFLVFALLFNSWVYSAEMSDIDDSDFATVFSENFETYHEGDLMTMTEDQRGWYLQTPAVEDFLCEINSQQDNKVLKFQGDSINTTRHQKIMNRVSQNGLEGMVTFYFKVFVPSGIPNPSGGSYNQDSTNFLQVNLEDNANFEMASFYFIPKNHGVEINVCSANADTGADLTKTLPSVAPLDSWLNIKVCMDTERQLFTFRISDDHSFYYELPSDESLYFRNKAASGFTGHASFVTAYLCRTSTNLLLYLDDIQLKQYIDPAVALVAEDKKHLELGFDSSMPISENFYLPIKGEINGSDIFWNCNNSSIYVDESGFATVTQTEEMQTAVLTATLTLNGFSDTKEFMLKIAPQSKNIRAVSVREPSFSLSLDGEEVAIEQPTDGFVNVEITVDNADLLTGELTLVVACIEKSTSAIIGIAADGTILNGEKTVTLKAGIEFNDDGMYEYQYFIWNNGYLPVMNCKPAAPPHPTLDKKVTKLNLSWEAAFDDFEAVNEYIIYRDGVELARTPALNYVDDTVEQNREYTYQVVAVDHEGLLSDPITLAGSTIAMPTAVLNGETQEEINAQSNGLTFIVNNVMENGDTYSVSDIKDNIPCRKTVERTEIGKGLTYLYFQADKSYITKEDKNLTFAVTYFDEGKGNIYMDYNAIPADDSNPNTNNVSKRITIANRSNSQTWKTVVFNVSDAQLRSPAALSNCDFRFAGSDDNITIYLSQVSVAKTEDY